ncbi:hypothetical protein KQX54_020935 [Cotesia glomerata]|uniref:Uncharacterized protein n=1 Tax=Cotesia glomerata TaxID=32391 RepID=A0AAV7J982_COTGL|nr:hypothetical protein KQX54_020935 [Cotesia glomerata]
MAPRTICLPRGWSYMVLQTHDPYRHIPQAVVSGECQTESQNLVPLLLLLLLNVPVHNVIAFPFTSHLLYIIAIGMREELMEKIQDR